MTCNKLQTYPVLWSAGDTLPEMGFKFGRPLTGLTFTMTLTKPDGTQAIRTHTDVDAANGVGKFAWLAGDLVAGKNQLVTVDLDNGSGGVQRAAKFFINVDES